ncbi:Bcr/CflA family multidrug efflux MFS transporter [Andreprevotia chitinilytica]|uniref:Bcr/CflA family multidrug efflux MFS transporter n=1 Tax=Andreprevotia chitinilytica TaxID=396808 RepID=UPI0005555316|nr:Bcr/CflA family multidrug efflux MFS transporter [Andreprevotia chitinilytica]
MNISSAARPSPSVGWVFILGALTAIAPLSIDMYLPSFPAIARELAAGHGAVQLTLAAFFLGITIGQLFYGPLSDRFGRKPPMYFGLALFVAAAIGCATAGTVEALTIWRFIQGLGGCAGMVIARAVVRDRYEPQQAARMFSMLMLVMGLAPILAPQLGGWLLQVASWRMIFAVHAVFGVACLLGIWRGLDETRDAALSPPLRIGSVLRDYVALLYDRQFIANTLTAGLVQGGMFTYIAGSPFVLIELYGVAPQHYGWVFATNAFGLIAAAQINARLLRGNSSLAGLLHRAVWVPMLAGLWLVAVTMLGQPPLAFLLLGFFAYLASLGFISPNASAGALVHQSAKAGTASAMMGCLQFTLASVAGVIMGAWQDGSARPLALVMAAFGIAALLVHRLWVARYVKG